MVMDKLRIIIPTCNQYIHLIEGLSYTIDKFWPNHGDVIIIGYDQPKFKLKDGYSFVSMGTQSGAQSWSNDLIRFFSNFKDEYFINLIDDTLMTRPTDEEQILYMIDMIKSDLTIGKISLHGSLYNSKDSKLIEGKYNLIEISQFADYRTSIQSAIWKRDYFMKLLKPNLNPWQFETQHIKNDGVRIISTKTNHPTMYSHLYRIGGKFQTNDWYKSVFEPTQLPDEDIKLIKEMLKL